MEIAGSFWNLVPVTLVQGLLYGYIALAVMIPFRLLAFPDLTSEGAFPLGGCVCAALLLAGANPLLATLGAVAGGMLAGLSTAFIHLRFRINTLLAGILVMTILYSVNLRVLGKSNAALLGMDSLLSWISTAVVTSVPLQIAVFAALALGVLGTLYWFLGTEIGLSLRAVGANAALAPALGINPWSYILGGLALASGLSALAGAVAVQLQGFADVHMGFGVLITGLASVIIGETLIGRQNVVRQLAAPVVGSLVYYQLVSLGLALGLKPADLKLATGLFVLVTLALPALRRGAEPEKLRE
ncbi:MAG TPA: ABC transporter permease [Burkholderiales bacterium]|jgi:putative ABC transport system permease protein|nr:ABC transporter permease [Burkholderiales bacterium]